MKGWINGKFVEAAKASVPLLSHTVGRGSAIFEVIDVVRTRKGPALFRVEEHVKRFFGTARVMGMPLPMSETELVKGIVEAVAENEKTMVVGVLKVLGYYPKLEFGLVPADRTVEVGVFSFTLEEVIGVDDARKLKPLRVGISEIRKPGPSTGAIQAKVAGNYVNAYLAKSEAISKGYDDAILLDDNGCVAECSLANIFFVKGGVVKTPRLTSALAGITRESTMEVIVDLGLKFEEKDIPAEQVGSMDEAFLTGTAVRVRPIGAIDGRVMCGGKPGTVTTRIREALDDAYDGKTEKYGKWLKPIK